VYVRDFEDILIGLVTGNTPNCVFNGRCGEYIVVEYNGDRNRETLSKRENERVQEESAATREM